MQGWALQKHGQELGEGRRRGLEGGEGEVGAGEGGGGGGGWNARRISWVSETNRLRKTSVHVCQSLSFFELRMQRSQTRLEVRAEARVHPAMRPVVRCLGCRTEVPANDTVLHWLACQKILRYLDKLAGKEADAHAKKKWIVAAQKDGDDCFELIQAYKEHERQEALRGRGSF